MSNFPNILSLIPQRPNFVMVDELVNVTDDTCSTKFTIRADNVLLDENSFSEGGLVENIAQTAAAHAGFVALNKNEPVKTGFIGAVTNLKITELPSNGSLLETNIKIENQIFDVTLISGQVSCEGRLVASCEMKIFLLPDNKITSK
ncbi:3-hydroxyacyl-ACP dehydratase [Pollutibacter soli]|uniref:3-hydroxyacyl-ACP dehydratase n=1 Tax=Pollutibacter soli TaxID=3034157 RepID=UPI00301361D7